MGYVGMGMKCAERRGDGLNHETPQNSDKHFQWVLYVQHLLHYCIFKEKLNTNDANKIE